MSALPTPEPTDAVARLRLHRWTDRAVVAIAITALAAGFGQFGVVAALGDVSKQLGHVAPEPRSRTRSGCRVRAWASAWR